ncbi:MAG: PilW family protein [Rhodoferax sp.]|nr:PilW family protein [Rhodoferax sp.]
MKHLNLPHYPAMHRLSPGLRSQRGVTLVEWMVSITIGLILLAGLTALIAQQSSTQAELEKSSRQIENGRYAMQLLNEDIQMAGYYGEFSNVAGLTVPGALPDPCVITVTAIDPAMVLPVQGYNAPTTVLPTCINAANHVSGTDILVVRRVEAAPLTIASAASAAGGQVYLQSGLTPSGLLFEKVMGTGANTGVFTLQTQAKPAVVAASGVTAAAAIPAAPAPLRKFLVHIYFVSPCSVMSDGSNCSASDDGGNPIPTLKRMELPVSGTTMITTPLVEGIENMQIDYGIDSTGNDGTPDGKFVAAPATVTDWANVVAVRVHLLARNNETSAGFVDPKTYEMGFVDNVGSVQIVTPATAVRAYKRRLFSQLIRAVNPSARRAQ